MMRRVSHSQLLTLADELGDRERLVLREVARLRLVSHAQLGRLVPAPPDVQPASWQRGVRRTLARLAAADVLGRLERRIGGVRAGSAGYCFYVGPVGQRLLAFWEGQGLVRGRRLPEPGSRYVRHRLAISELYVLARERERAGGLAAEVFDIEPECWRRTLDRFGNAVTLKPDAYVTLHDGAHELHAFVEVDLGTESRTVIAGKLRVYLDHFRAGSEQARLGGVFPFVVWVTTSEARRGVIVDVCASLPPETWQLFVVTTIDRAVSTLTELCANGSDGLAHPVRSE